MKTIYSRPTSYGLKHIAEDYKNTYKELVMSTKRIILILTITLLLCPTMNAQETGAVTDIEGNVYLTIKIGDQLWMAENLKVSRYRNGDNIPNVPDTSEWVNLTTGAWVYYNNDSSNDETYGKLYNWYAVDDNRGLCPTGWHVPSEEEWTTLTIFLIGRNVGGTMKSTTGWNSPNTGATNESGFSGLPGGNRNSDGDFNNIRLFVDLNS